ncbi:hypothetical protein [Victivallis sp. Marseille-Q1083]|uniref:hypothetical protein n=1 Tax=Victivallis sp. Marseille-Q1083 TaxID=2717288 RepID=UPI00158C8502|nr:hypothetical protein [Victivallis sp. Marseille-Q1083]
MELTFNFALLAVMLCTFIVIHICKKREKTLHHASLYAILALLVLLVSCGLFLWLNFLRAIVTDAGSIALERAEMQWYAQGWRMARILTEFHSDDLNNTASILVLHGGMANQKSRLDAFVAAMTANGVPQSAIELHVVPVSGPRAGIAPAESLVTTNDLKKAMSHFSGPVVISLLGVPSDAAANRFDFTKRGRQLFVAGGDVTNYTSEVLQMVQNGKVDALVQTRLDAPQFGETYSRDPERAFNQFYTLVTSTAKTP